MAGTYQLSMAIMAITENQCFVKLPDLSDYSVIVNNQQELYDIYPPSYINFALEKSTVPMGMRSVLRYFTMISLISAPRSFRIIESVKRLNMLEL